MIPFTTETFDDKAQRDARYAELHGRKHVQKFSGVRPVMNGDGQQGRPVNYPAKQGHFNIVIRPVFISTWSVSYPK